MKISILTTWDSFCGIAQYSKNLVNEFLDMGDNVTILSNDQETQKNKKIIGPCFGVNAWGESPEINIDKIKKEVKDCDVFHVQYHGSFYGPEFNKMVSLLRPEVKKMVVTLHDSSKHPLHRFKNFDDIIVHNELIDEKTIYIPMPVPKTEPARIFSMGMNRSQTERIQKVCDDLGLIFISHDGKDNWISEEELRNIIKSCDAIVLWYNNVKVKGSSASAAFALSCYRPTFVNDIAWFDSSSGVFMFTGEEDLKEQLTINLNLDIVDNNSFLKFAEKHKEIYAMPQM